MKACTVPEAVDKAKLNLNFSFFISFVDVRASNDFFTKADVLFFVLGNAFDVSLAFTACPKGCSDS